MKSQNPNPKYQENPKYQKLNPVKGRRIRLSNCPTVRLSDRPTNLVVLRVGIYFVVFVVFVVFGFPQHYPIEKRVDINDMVQ
jgi:hypothetical protein